MIESDDLTKHFDTFVAVDGIALRVRAGQALALLGQNGAGKTTTVRMLTSILSPTRGWARVAGYNVTKQAAQVRASVGVLTEMHGLYTRMSANEYLDFFGGVYGLDPAARKRRAAELLEYFGLQPAAQRRSGEYSKGMRQKLALARALIHEPPVLLLDEPTSAMDPESAQLVRQEIARLKSAQRAIILCTHNLQEAEMLADSIAIIYQGRILLQGTLSELRLRLLGAPQYEAIFAAPAAPQGLESFPGLELLSRSESGFCYRAAHPETVNPALLQLLVAQNLPVLTLQEREHSLEQVYLSAMKMASRGEL